MSEVLQLFQKLSTGKQVDAEFLFPNLTFRRGKEGPIHRVSFEITEDLWTALKHLPADIRLRAPLQVVPDDEGAGAVTARDGPLPEPKAKAEKTPKQPKGEHGMFWCQMLKPHTQIHLTPGIREALADQIEPAAVWTPEVIKTAFKRIFGLSDGESLSFVSPAQVRERFPTKQVEIMTEQCERDAARGAKGAGA